MTESTRAGKTINKLAGVNESYLAQDPDFAPGAADREGAARKALVDKYAKAKPMFDSWLKQSGATKARCILAEGTLTVGGGIDTDAGRLIISSVDGKLSLRWLGKSFSDADKKAIRDTWKSGTGDTLSGVDVVNDLARLGYLADFTNKKYFDTLDAVIAALV